MRPIYIFSIVAFLQLALTGKAQSEETTIKAYVTGGICATMDFYDNHNYKAFSPNASKYEQNVPAMFYGPHVSLAYFIRTQRKYILQTGIEYYLGQYYIAQTGNSDRFPTAIYRNIHLRVNNISLPLYANLPVAHNQLLLGLGLSMDILPYTTMNADKDSYSYPAWGNPVYSYQKVTNKTGFAAPWDIGSMLKFTWFIKTKANPLVLEIKYKHGWTNITSSKYLQGAYLHQEYITGSIGYSF